MANFATLTDLAIRLGRIDEDALTEAQRAQGTMLLGLASGLIRDAVGRGADWTPDPASVTLRAVCLEVCARVMTNPAGVRSEGETLGVHQHSVSYPDGSSSLYLTDRELALCRREGFGGSSGSAALESLATVVAESMPSTLDGLLDEGPDDRPIYYWAD